MNIAGFDVKINPEEEKLQPVCLFISADPEGDPVINALEDFKKRVCRYSFWVGDREQKHFDSFIGTSSSLMEVYSTLFRESGVKA